AGGRMMSNAYFIEHQLRIERQRVGRPLGALTAGHKKDLVVTNRLLSHPGRVAIYGWHLPNGVPVQPLSTKHESTYADYSHGVRLVGATMRLDDTDVAVADVLADPSLCDLLSDEGTIINPR